MSVVTLNRPSWKKQAPIKRLIRMLCSAGRREHFTRFPVDEFVVPFVATVFFLLVVTVCLYILVLFVGVVGKLMISRLFEVMRGVSLSSRLHHARRSSYVLNKQAQHWMVGYDECRAPTGASLRISNYLKFLFLIFGQY